MNIYIILAILLIHWYADFVLQTDRQAKEKSYSNKSLTAHAFTYSSVWLLMSCCGIGEFGVKFIFFAPITFVCHWVTDYFTSRLNSRLWAKGDVHNFFVSVGFGQFLHSVQLLLTFQVLS